jgi:hypothetical protein
VLWIFRNAERRNNAAESFLRHHPPILTQALLTTIEEFKADPLRTIWVRPIDYRNAVADTEFNPARNRDSTTYRRQPEREKHVEEKLAKVQMITQPDDQPSRHSQR